MFEIPPLPQPLACIDGHHCYSRRQFAEMAGVCAEAISMGVSRGNWPKPDFQRWGQHWWKEETISAYLAARTEQLRAIAERKAIARGRGANSR
jgi:hypothetical protein